MMKIRELYSISVMIVCVCVCGEMTDFGKSDKMIKVDKTNADNGFNISFFIGNITLSESIQNQILMKLFPIMNVSLWFINFSTYI